METLSLNVFGIAITWDGQDRRGASITSDMKETDTLDNHAFNTGVDGIKSMVLAHFCAGMDIMEPAYLEGIETAYQSLGNHCDDETLCSTVERFKNSATINELSSSAVDNMGDIFWDAAEHGETENLPGDIAQDCVKEAIISALDYVLLKSEDQAQLSKIARPKLQFAVYVNEGGRIDSVFCKNTKGFDCEFSIYEYDVDNLDEEDITLITQPDGKKAEAYVYHQGISDSPVIDLDEVFNA